MLRDILRSANARDGGQQTFGEYLARKARRPCKWSGIGIMVLRASRCQLLASPHCAPVRSSPLELGRRQESPSMYEDLSPDQECPFCIPVLTETMQHRHQQRCRRLREFNLLHRRRLPISLLPGGLFIPFPAVPLGRANGGMAPFFRSLSFIISRP